MTEQARIQPKILIVEDDEETASAMVRSAQAVEAEVALEITFEAGLETARAGDFDVIVMDRMLPGGDGIDAIARLRAAGSTALVLIVSALGRAANKIEGLEKGADDYLAKPFEADELQARLRALLRRKRMVVLDNDLIAFGPLEIRMKARTVYWGREHIAVSPKEFELVTFFARNAGQTVTRMQLLENVWNLHFDPQTNVVDVHVGRLRRKLEEVAGRTIIATSRGEGYVFMPAQGG